MYITLKQKKNINNFCDQQGDALHDLAAASNSRKHATGALLETSISESTRAIQSSKKHLRCDRSDKQLSNHQCYFRS